MSGDAEDLEREARRASYGLRSTFFYRKLYELDFMGFSNQIATLIEKDVPSAWDLRQEWAISESAWTQIWRAGLQPLRVFCRPDIVAEQPRLLGYYRSLAAIPQKGVQALTGLAPSVFEQRGRLLRVESALVLARLTNEHISAIIDSAVQITAADLDAMVFASAGAQIDGSWRNAIGVEADAMVRRFIIGELMRRGKVVALVRRGHEVPLAEVDETDIAARVSEFERVLLDNDASIRFGSDPDVSLWGPSGVLAGVIEVKGGTDTAGALERLGAAHRSFLAAQETNPFVSTIFISGCITTEMQRRIDDAKRLNHVFEHVIHLSEVLASEDARSALMVTIARLLSLQ